MKPKAFRRWLIQTPVARAATSLVEQLDRMPDGQVRVLNFHRLTSADTFDEQMTFLASSCRVIPVSDLLDAIDGKMTLPRRAIAITFDDADRDFEDVAWPILRRLGLPATVFVPTGFPDQPDMLFWWDRLEHAFRTSTLATVETSLGSFSIDGESSRWSHFRRHRDAVKRLPHDEGMAMVDRVCAQLEATTPESRVMSWDTIRRLASEGVEMAPHTRTHPILTQIDPDAAREEIVNSMRDLERELGGMTPALAYPNGGYSPAICEIAAASGLRAGFTTVRGTVDPSAADRWRLRRIDIGPWCDVIGLRMRLIQASPRFRVSPPMPESA